jgi:transcriptional regulator with XRE-family HTH domain
MSDGERDCAVELGRLLKRLRLEAAVTQADLARGAEIGERHLRRVEAGERRTRSSTLLRLAGTLSQANADLGSADEIHRRLIAVAGVSLAPESRYADRVDARRARRSKGRARRERTVHETRYLDRGGAVVERHEHSWPDGSRRRRRRVYFLLRCDDGVVLRVPANPEIDEWFLTTWRAMQTRAGVLALIAEVEAACRALD